MQHNAESPTRIIIEPPKGWHLIDLREVWNYRDFLFLWTYRNISANYRQSVLGPLWAVLSPIASMVLFTFVFGNLAKMPSDDIPYPLFSFSGLLVWTYFSNTVTLASSSILANRDIIKKVYFPRIIIPISSMLSGLVDFLISFIILAIMVVVYLATTASSAISISSNILLLPFFTLLGMVTALGFGVWFGALNAQFRDANRVLSLVLRFWLYLTPVAYSGAVFSEPVATLVKLNPMTTVVDGFRWGLLGTDTAPGLESLAAVGISLFVLVTGLLYFRYAESTLVDVM